jgi:uncharacterized protein (TIGR00661 family)
MKILYAVQATGNGHISRAMELLPYLQEHGEVDIFLSGNNSHLALQAPVKYRSKGLSLFYNQGGGLSYSKTALRFNPFRLLKEAAQLPVEKYDMVINDFESITSLACKLKRVPSVQFGHQASFQSALTPRPEKKDIMGEWILKNYARATAYIGLHFKSYDSFILSPIIKQEILEAEPENKNHITIYLPAYPDAHIMTHLAKFRSLRFEIFSRETTQVRQEKNITLLPIDKALFNQSLINCNGIITGAGFETPAEALYLGKKLMVIPIKGQYEQQCNAAALEQLGVKKINTIDHRFAGEVTDWLHHSNSCTIHFRHSTRMIVEHLFEHYPYGMNGEAAMG